MVYQHIADATYVFTWDGDVSTVLTFKTVKEGVQHIIGSGAEAPYVYVPMLHADCVLHAV